jgi:hypothetical protein
MVLLLLWRQHHILSREAQEGCLLGLMGDVPQLCSMWVELSNRLIFAQRPKALLSDILKRFSNWQC